MSTQRSRKSATHGMLNCRTRRPATISPVNGGALPKMISGFHSSISRFAGGNNSLDPVPSHVRNVNQSVVMALDPVQSRVAQPPAFSRGYHGSPSGRALRAAAEIPPQEIEPVLARPIFRIDVFSRNLEWQASIFDNVCRQNA